MITILTVFLFIVGTVLSLGLFAAKKQITPAASIISTKTQAPIGDLKLDNINTTTNTATSTVTPIASPAK
jgi:hypothetical protein